MPRTALNTGWRGICRGCWIMTNGEISLRSLIRPGSRARIPARIYPIILLTSTKRSLCPRGLRKISRISCSPVTPVISLPKTVTLEKSRLLLPRAILPFRPAGRNYWKNASRWWSGCGHAKNWPIPNWNSQASSMSGVWTAKGSRGCAVKATRRFLEATRRWR